MPEFCFFAAFIYLLVINVGFQSSRDRRPPRGRSTSGAVMVSLERQLNAVSFGNPFSSVGHHLSAAAPR